MKEDETTMPHISNQCEDDMQMMDAVVEEQLLEEHVIELNMENWLLKIVKRRNNY